MKPTEWLRHTPAPLLVTRILIALTRLHSYLVPTLQQVRDRHLPGGRSAIGRVSFPVK